MAPLPEETPEQSEPEGRQVSDLLESASLAKAIDSDDFKDFLDHVPIAIIVSKTLEGDQRIIYVNKAFEDQVAGVRRCEGARLVKLGLAKT
jgi:hypothetical protein